jgi:hypothetical protein
VFAQRADAVLLMHEKWMQRGAKKKTAEGKGLLKEKFGTKILV